MSGWGCFPLACRHGHVCIGRVVVLLVILRMFSSCLELVCGVIVTFCLDCVLAFIVSGMIKLLSSLPSLTTHVFQQRTNTFNNHSHNQIKYQHTDVFMW
jgi:hypothetical protein